MFKKKLFEELVNFLKDSGYQEEFGLFYKETPIDRDKLDINWLKDFITQFNRRECKSELSAYFLAVSNEIPQEHSLLIENFKKRLNILGKVVYFFYKNQVIDYVYENSQTIYDLDLFTRNTLADVLVENKLTKKLVSITLEDYCNLNFNNKIVLKDLDFI